jgi:acyl-CoA thioester hydrolase
MPLLRNSPPPTLIATAETVVRFNECDPLGIVWHANYLHFFEDGREAFSKKFNFDFHEFYAKGLAVPFVHASLDYKKTLSFRDKIKIEVSYVHTPASKIVFEYKIILIATNEVVCTGKTIQVFIDSKTKELHMTLPSFFVAWQKQVGLL